jgi:hypothetical protein
MEVLQVTDACAGVVPGAARGFFPVFSFRDVSCSAHERGSTPAGDPAPQGAAWRLTNSTASSGSPSPSRVSPFGATMVGIILDFIACQDRFQRATSFTTLGMSTGRTSALEEPCRRQATISADSPLSKGSSVPSERET